MTNLQDSPSPEEDGADAQDPVPTTEDGIPLKVNGQWLDETQIAALREARDRREQEAAAQAPKEVGGAARDTDPTRFGDWEKDGRAVDFS